MSEKISNKEGGVEEYEVLDNANGRNDVPKKGSNVINVDFDGFRFFENETKYKNNSLDDNPDAEGRIEEFKEKRGLGGKVRRLYTKGAA